MHPLGRETVPLVHCCEVVGVADGFDVDGPGTEILLVALS